LLTGSGQLQRVSEHDDPLARAMRRPDLPANQALRCIKYTALSFFAGEPGSYKRISITVLRG
jgi:hypothetical protein